MHYDMITLLNCIFSGIRALYPIAKDAVALVIAAIKKKPARGGRDRKRTKLL